MGHDDTYLGSDCIIHALCTHIYIYEYMALQNRIIYSSIYYSKHQCRQQSTIHTACAAVQQTVITEGRKAPVSEVPKRHGNAYFRRYFRLLYCNNNIKKKKCFFFTLIAVV